MLYKNVSKVKYAGFISGKKEYVDKNEKIMIDFPSPIIKEFFKDNEIQEISIASGNLGIALQINKIWEKDK